MPKIFLSKICNIIFLLSLSFLNLLCMESSTNQVSEQAFVWNLQNARGKGYEDNFVKICETNTSFFGVFDGHGIGGHIVPIYLLEHLYQNIKTEPTFESDIKEAVKNGFLKTDRQILSDGLTGGSTAITALIKNKRIFLANVGDSKALIFRKFRDRTPEIILETKLHKPKNLEDKIGIERRGGSIFLNPEEYHLTFKAIFEDIKNMYFFMDQLKEQVYIDSLERYFFYFCQEESEPKAKVEHDLLLGLNQFFESKPYDYHQDLSLARKRLFSELSKQSFYRVINRETGYSLAMSRSFGDLELKPAISCEPEIYEYEIKPEDSDSFLVLASDGIWDYMEDNDELIFGLADNPDIEISCRAFAENFRRKLQEKNIPYDDITLMVVPLKDYV